MAVPLGRWDEPDSGEGPIDAARRVDAQVGSPSAFTRHYVDVEDNWDGGWTKWGLQTNRIPVYGVHSWDANKNAINWSRIANGDYDDQWRTQARNLLDLMNQIGSTVPAYLGFHHEPENEEDGKVSGDITGTCGTRQDCKAAAQHFFSIVKPILGNKARYGMTLMVKSFHNGQWNQWIPSGVDWYGVDGYSHGNPKETFASIFPDAHDAAVKDGKKLFIQEMGAEEVAGQSNWKAQFFNDARNMLKGWGECIGVEYSNVDAKGDYHVDTSNASLNAYKAWVQDAAFKSAAKM